MLIFSEENLVLFAVPKTGTTALEAAFAPRATVVLRNPPDLKHMPLYRFNRLFVPLLEKTGVTNLETIATVRHPVDWLRSWYKFRARPALEGRPQSTANLSFDDFVRGYLQNKRPPPSNIGSQAKFLTYEEQMGADHMFQYEQLDKLVDFLAERLNKRVDLPRKNVSPDREAPLSPGLEKRLQQKFPDDFALWEGAGR